MTAAAAKYELDPLFYDVDATEEDVSYDRWFRAKVQEALDSKKPRIPHDAAMARVAANVARRRKERVIA